MTGWLPTPPKVTAPTGVEREALERAFAEELMRLEMRCDQVEAMIRDARRKDEGDGAHNERQTPRAIAGI